MSEQLRQALRDAKPTLTPAQETAVTFARLELYELQAGLRTLGQCPGLESIAEHIRAHKQQLAEEIRKRCKTVTQL